MARPLRIDIFAISYFFDILKLRRTGATCGLYMWRPSLRIQLACWEEGYVSRSNPGWKVGYFEAYDGYRYDSSRRSLESRFRN